MAVTSYDGSSSSRYDGKALRNGLFVLLPRRRGGHRAHLRVSARPGWAAPWEAVLLRGAAAARGLVERFDIELYSDFSAK